MKSAHEIAIERSDDEMIVIGMTTDLGTYYRLGNKITVRAGTNHWLCLTCQSSDRWADKERKGCTHIERVKRFVSEHPQNHVLKPTDL